MKQRGSQIVKSRNAGKPCSLKKKIKLHLKIAYTFNILLKKFLPTRLLGPTRLLNFKISSHLHCYLDSTLIRPMQVVQYILLNNLQQVIHLQQVPTVGLAPTLVPRTLQSQGHFSPRDTLVPDTLVPDTLVPTFLACFGFYRVAMVLWMCVKVCAVLYS